MDKKYVVKLACRDAHRANRVTTLLALPGAFEG
jgi:hypothetical protein